MNILGCLDRPTRGRYLLAGEDVSDLSKAQLAHIRNRRLGFIFQSYNLLPRTSAIENVILPLIYSRNGATVPDDQMYLRAVEALTAVGLADRTSHQPHELSGGQAQRVAIARALINDPAMILADEPTGNLDSRSGGEIMDILHALNAQGRTIVMVTHDPLVAQHATRIIRFLDGRIASDERNGVHNVQTQDALEDCSALQAALDIQESTARGAPCTLERLPKSPGKVCTRNKLRSLLTMLGVIIGVAAVIVMISISAGTEKAIRDRITGLGSNLVFVQAAFSRMGPGMQSAGGGLVYDDAWAIRDNLSGVKSVDVTQNSVRDRQSRRRDRGGCHHPGHHLRLPLRARYDPGCRALRHPDRHRPQSAHRDPGLQPGERAVRRYQPHRAGGQRGRCQADRDRRLRAERAGGQHRLRRHALHPHHPGLR